MHSDLDQQRRDDVMLEFRAGHTDILITTDIVARGIDIDDISMVVNFDVPREAEDYVHRVGRTARAGTDGKAVTLVGPRDRRAFSAIESFLKSKIRREWPFGEHSEEPVEKPKRIIANATNVNRQTKSQKPTNPVKTENQQAQTPITMSMIDAGAVLSNSVIRALNSMVSIAQYSAILQTDFYKHRDSCQESYARRFQS